VTPSQYQRLQAIKLQLDALFAELGEQPAPPTAITLLAPATMPPTAEHAGGFGRGRAAVNCDHPPKKRESLNGFGAGPNRWRCGECGHTEG
jgi:hypothetical protein